MLATATKTRRPGRKAPRQTLDARPLLAAIEATLDAARALKAQLVRLPGDRAPAVIEDLDGLVWAAGITGSLLETELSPDGTLDARRWASDWGRDLQAVRAMA